MKLLSVSPSFQAPAYTDISHVYIYIYMYRQNERKQQSGGAAQNPSTPTYSSVSSCSTQHPEHGTVTLQPVESGVHALSETETRRIHEDTLDHVGAPTVYD